jgi:thymidylate kinase
MIILIEGTRNNGKTYLIEKFFSENKNPNIVYYKFQFAKYIEELGMKDQETGPGVHYFSIANVLTILELNKTLLESKILIFDRSIFSAYVWSIYRNRMDKSRLLLEFEKILMSDLYQEVKVISLERGHGVEVKPRDKDYFGNFENFNLEKVLFDEIFEKFKPIIKDKSRNNDFIKITNNFDEESVSRFNETLLKLIEKR